MQPEWYEMWIIAKELIPIILLCIIWELCLAKHHINFQYNNADLVIAINKGLNKDKFLMHLLHSLSIFVVHFDIYITASKLPGVIM